MPAVFVKSRVDDAGVEALRRKGTAMRKRLWAGVAWASVCSVTGARAAVVTWQGPVDGEAEWNETAYWPGSTLPVQGDTVIINGNRTMVVGEATTVEGITVNVPGGSATPGALRLDGGTLLNTPLTLGGYPASTGVVEVLRGTLETTNTLNLRGVCTVVMSGGSWSNKEFNAGGPAVLFTQDGGTNRTPDLRIGTGGAGSVTRYILNGGLLDCTGNIKIGYGGYGYMEVNGEAALQSPTFYIPQNSFDVGELAVNRHTNFFKAFEIATQGNARHSFTGRVTLTESDITVGTVNLAGNLSNSYAHITVDGGRLWVSNNLTLREGTDTPLGKRAILVVTNNAELLVARAEEDIYNSSSWNLTVGNGGELYVRSGTVRVSDRLFLNAGGIVEMTGGVFKPKRVFTGYGYQTPAVFRMMGGLFQPNNDWFYLGGDGNSVTNSFSQGPVFFLQSGGVVSNSNVVLSRGSTNHISQYEIRGGTLALTTQLQINTNDVSEFRVIGPAPEVRLGTIADAFASSFLLEYVLTGEPGHLAPIRCSSTAAYRCGHLRARLDGGVLLAATNAWAVMRKENGTFNDTRNYLSVPDANLWNTSLTADAKESVITMAGKQAELAVRGAPTAVFPAAPMGHVTVGGVVTNFLIDLVFRLRVKAADGSAMAPEAVTALADGLIAAGYTNSAAETSGSYNLKVAVPRERVAPGDLWFAWDFTRTEGVKTVGVAMTNAVVDAVSVETVKEVGDGSVLFLL